MNKIWTLLVGLLLCVNGQAHSLSTTAIDLYQVNGLWVAQFTISQEGANIALEQTWGQSLQSFDPQAFKEKYIAYVKERVQLTSNGRPIALGEGGIKLGAHETKMTFMLPTLASGFEELNMHIPLFETLEGQHTLFRIEKDGIKSKAILKASNDFTASFDHGEITYQGAEKEPTFGWWWVALALLALAAALIYKKV